MVPQTKNVRVLVIDNDNDILDVLNEALTYEGYEVNSLCQVEDILPELQKYRPDIVIMDYILNGINGGELCQQIKINTPTAKLPVLMISAYPRVLQSLGNYGCNVFIPKPFDLDHIVNSIQALTQNTNQTELC
ncbi:MAG: response regulator [Mucilaginibacter sp.]